MALRFVVLGAGLMGRAVAFDLARSSPDAEIIIADVDAGAAETLAGLLAGRVRPLHLDVYDQRALRDALQGTTVAIGAVSYSANLRITRAALDAGAHMVDLGGNDDVVRQQLALDGEARARGVTVLPNCGLAPGLINILGAAGAACFERVDTVQLRVGGLPQHPRPPLNYQITFSVDGLINEYSEKARVIRNGRIVEVESLSELEEIEFPLPFGTLEAFATSGGVSLLPELLLGSVANLDYKTIRYKGHCEKFRTLLELGFASNEPVSVGAHVRTNRELFAQLLRRKLDFGDTDVVLLRAAISGTADGMLQTLTYDCIDYYDTEHQMTAMMRTTAFPVSIIAQMLAAGTLQVRGVMPPEYCVPAAPLITELQKRGITITTTLSEMQA